VDGISGATISAKAVVKILNAGNKEWLPRIPAPGSEPPLEKRPEQNEDKRD
jgi:hypothetical protein